MSYQLSDAVATIAGQCDDVYVQPGACNEHNPPGEVLIPMTEMPPQSPLPDTGGTVVDPVTAIVMAVVLVVLGATATFGAWVNARVRDDGPE